MEERSRDRSSRSRFEMPPEFCQFLINYPTRAVGVLAEYFDRIVPTADNALEQVDVEPALDERFRILHSAKTR